MRIRLPLVAMSVVGTIYGSSVVIKETFVAKYNGSERLEGKAVIVTGANTGLGKEAALQFARRGARVIMACRDLDKCHKNRADIVVKSGNKHVKCSQLDLASFQSINDFAKRIKQHEESIHILVNNAGVMRCPKSVTKDGIEMQIGVNHFGHFLLTNLLLDLLKNAPPNRVINVSSSAHKRGEINFDDLNSEKSYDEGKAYAQSKLANILFTRELARRVKSSGVYVFAVHPGVVNTEITRHMGYAKSYVSAVFAKPFLSLLLLSPKQGVATILYCALNEELASDQFTGKYFANCREQKPSDAATDDVTARKLWLLSERWTRLSDSVSNKEL